MAEEPRLTHNEAESQLMDIDGLDVGFWDVLLDWLLFIFSWGLLVLVPALLYVLWWWMHRPAKAVRDALSELKEHGASMPASEWVGRANHLLKGQALLHWPREEVATLHGHAWVGWLQLHVVELDRTALNPLADSAYQPGMEPLANHQPCAEAVAQLARRMCWLRRIGWLKKQRHVVIKPTHA